MSIRFVCFIHIHCLSVYCIVYVFVPHIEMALQLNETPFSTTQNTYSCRYCFSLFFEQIQREMLKTIKKAYGGEKAIEICWQLLHLCQNGGHRREKKRMRRKMKTSTTMSKNDIDNGRKEGKNIDYILAGLFCNCV